MPKDDFRQDNATWLAHARGEPDLAADIGPQLRPTPSKEMIDTALECIRRAPSVLGHSDWCEVRGGERHAHAIEAMAARIQTLEQALEPFAQFGRQWARKPMRGMDDVIHAIHTGTEWEAEIKHTDMARAAQVLKEITPHGKA